MARDTVLIAAFSGRALAESARRAGYEPLVADAFGDLDTRAAASRSAVVPGAAENGFRTKPLVSTLDALIADSASQPIGLVLGSGLEDKPRLLDLLDRRFGLLGCGSETIAACKDPVRFFSAVRGAGVAYPETQMNPPVEASGWLSKRIGGSGGRHIRICGKTARAKPRRYFQRQLDGTRMSVNVVASSGGATYALTHQWCAPSDRQPFRYGGAVRVPIDERNPVHRRLRNDTARLIEPLGIIGMASFDYIVVNDDPYLLEVNPRLGAALDVLDDDNGTLFAAHIAASLRNDMPETTPATTRSRAAAILHADRGAVTLSEVNWPDWTADRGASGTYVPEGTPLATVHADAATPEAAERSARARLAELSDLLYEKEKTKQKRSAR